MFGEPVSLAALRFNMIRQLNQLGLCLTGNQNPIKTAARERREMVRTADSVLNAKLNNE